MLQGPIPAAWAQLRAISLADLRQNLGICGGVPGFPAGTAVLAANTNVRQSCLLSNTSGLVASLVFGEHVCTSVQPVLLCFMSQTLAT